MFDNSRSTAAAPTSPADRSEAAGAGPARPFLTCRGLCEWVVKAQPNARLDYAHGVQWEQSCRSELRDQVLKLQKLQLVTSHFVRGRDGVPDRHLVQRTQRPYLAGMLLS